ncbi:class II histocompatibility antigen, B-L beta chain-like [Cyanocitta cristata]
MPGAREGSVLLPVKRRRSGGDWEWGRSTPKSAQPMGARRCCVVIGVRAEPRKKSPLRNCSQSERAWAVTHRLPGRASGKRAPNGLGQSERAQNTSSQSLCSQNHARPIRARPRTTPDQSEVASVMTPQWSGLELPVQRGCFGAGGSCPALAMGRVAAAGAVLVALVVLGAPPAAGEKLSRVLQAMINFECHFINGTEKVRYVVRSFYNRLQIAIFDSDVGHYVGVTPYGEKLARYWNSDPVFMEHRRTAVDWYCRHNYGVFTPFLVEYRVRPRSLPVRPSVSISLVPSSSQPSPGRLLCSVMDFYPAEIQVRWFQGQQELSGHVVATDIVPNGDWTYQLLVLLEIPPQRGVSYTCQVEHVSLEQPLSLHWEMPPDAGRSKMLTGIGGFVLGFVFLALGLGFYLRKKSS